jgi:predicted GIY-YIG superfamily endonuclease
MYLVEDEARGLMQIGITNNRDERLSKHRRGGFDKVLDVRGPLDGILARDLERACMRSLEKRGAVFVKDLDMERFDGWTEAWSNSTMNPTNIAQILEMVYEDD